VRGDHSHDLRIFQAKSLVSLVRSVEIGPLVIPVVDPEHCFIALAPDHNVSIFLALFLFFRWGSRVRFDCRSKALDDK